MIGKLSDKELLSAKESEPCWWNASNAKAST